MVGGSSPIYKEGTTRSVRYRRRAVWLLHLPLWARSLCLASGLGTERPYPSVWWSQRVPRRQCQYWVAHNPKTYWFQGKRSRSQVESWKRDRKGYIVMDVFQGEGGRTWQNGADCRNQNSISSYVHLVLFKLPSQTCFQYACWSQRFALNGMY